MPPAARNSQLQTRVVAGELGQGIFYDRSEIDIPVGGASAASNLVWFNGLLRPRPGLTSAYPKPNGRKITHLSRYTTSDGTTTLLRVSTDNGTTLYVEEFDTGWADVTPGVGIASILSNNYDPRSVNFKDYWFLAPGDNSVYVYDGASLVTLNSMISDAAKRPFADPRIMVTTESRMVFANVLSHWDRTDPSAERVGFRLCWCDRINPFVWTRGPGTALGSGSAGWSDLPSDNEPITAVYAGPNSTMMVFTDTKLYLAEFTGAAPWLEHRLLYRGPGCISQRTIQEWRDGQVVWLGNYNVYIGVVGQQPQGIGDAIRTELLRLASVSDLRQARAFIDRDNDLYVLIFPDSASSGRMLRTFTLNLRNGSWWPGIYSLPGESVTDTLQFNVGVWNQKELLATDQGSIYESSFNTTSDAGNPFSVSWTSGTLSYRTLTQNQTEQGSLQQIRGLAASGAVDFSAQVGDGLDRFQNYSFGTQQFDGSAEVKTTERLTSEHFRIQLQRDDAASMAHLAGLGIGFILEGMTR